MYSNNILNFQESTTILNACTKKSGKLLLCEKNSLETNIQKYKYEYTMNVIPSF